MRPFQKTLLSAFRRLYRRANFNPLPLIALGFAGLILLGSALLSLPVASADGRACPWFDALFTATSAVCVTGLVVRDTGQAFSTFGHGVLLVLIETGGLGFMTFATLILRAAGRHVSLRERMLLRDSFNEDQVGGVLHLVRWVVVTTLTVELCGAALFAVRFIPRYGWARGAFYAVFHAVSAFCNAGFDLVGRGESLTGFRGDILINLTVIFLVVAGGLGFPTLQDLWRRRARRHLRLQTKLVLTTYFSMMLAAFLLVLAVEWSNPRTLGPLSVPEKLMAALFQSMTLRTAGFNTIDQQGLRDATKLASGLFMLVGCAPASTGGGIKVTTFAVLLLTARMVTRGDKNLGAFERRIDVSLAFRSLTIALLAVSVALADLFALSLMHPGFAFLDLYYECFSAIGTVGISAVGSGNLLPAARAMLIVTMYLGRIGPLTGALILSGRQKRRGAPIQYPEESVMIG